MMKQILMVCIGLGVAMAMPQFLALDQPQPGLGLLQETYKAFDNSYSVDDGYGNQQGHQSSQTEQGVRSGSYYMQLANGLFRKIDYIDAGNGIVMTLASNEPGLGPDSPADATFNIQEPPAGIYEDRGNQKLVYV